MIRTWDETCNVFEKLINKDKKFLYMYNLVIALRDSKYANYIYGWTSVNDLYIVQNEVEYPYDGPRLLISPLENDKFEFRFIDTDKYEKQWKRIYSASEGFKELEKFFFNIHWFYPNFIKE